MSTDHRISRELMGKIVDDVFDGAIEDASVIEDIYAAIKRHESTPAPVNRGIDPLTKEVRAVIFGFLMCPEIADCDQADMDPETIALEKRARILVVDDQHPDDAAVDQFARAMKDKLATKRAEGYGGWHDPAQCRVEILSRKLREHVAKSDPVDVGNFAMMLHQRGSIITDHDGWSEPSEVRQTPIGWAQFHIDDTVADFSDDPEEVASWQGEGLAIRPLFDHAAPAPELRADVTYVVWSNEHKCWWGPNRAGYCSRLDDAGRYTRDEALKICVNARGGRQFNSNPSEVPLPLDDAERFWPDDKEEWRIARHKHGYPELWEDEE
jgi:hypothetical protein